MFRTSLKDNAKKTKTKIRRAIILSTWRVMGGAGICGKGVGVSSKKRLM